MWTDLYHNHTESEDVCFPRNHTSSLENLWRSPHCSIPIYLYCRIHSVNNRGKVKIRQMSTAIVIDENVGLAKVYQ